MFNRKDLVRLLVPLVIEQVLAITIGMADTIMISSCGEVAVSGVSLVDSISILLINIFSALATGGAVVVAQHLGNRDSDSACRSAKQLYLFAGAVSLVLGVAALAGNRHILRLVFGHVEDAVMDNAVVYFALSAVSYPFLAVYNAGAALFRSMGNSKVSMYTALLMNVVNIAGNAIFIFGMDMGTAGAGIATLISRAGGAVIMFWLSTRREYPVHLEELKNWKPEWNIIRNIMKIGVPNGFENSLFQLGKVLVQGLIASFGTTAIAANAVAGNIAGMVLIPGSAVGLALVTVVGQCVGAGDKQGAKRYARLLTGVAIGGLAITSLLTIAGLPWIVGIYDLPEATAALTSKLILTHNLTCILFWPISFTLPNALRAAGDAKYTMMVSIISMWICRIGCSFLLASVLDMGVMGVWIGMYIDWIVRCVCFTWRYLRGRWLEKKII